MKLLVFLGICVVGIILTQAKVFYVGVGFILAWAMVVALFDEVSGKIVIKKK